ncbi:MULTISPECIES: ABC transporter ATP-binding protein [unclassified Pseudonocardia]|uniref:ABC transporter ATP-binding protein n=1 Tax=unclassified Pseudonocardia TaxID=2619320 RepID=UPI00094AC6A5|nr:MULTISPECIES: ABC transporter ATP-binding protein [unclassified Pseudonocardia]
MTAGVTAGTTLSVRGIVAGYGGAPVLHGVDLDAGPGELVSVLGASGSGKTTLLRVVAGLHRPDAGTVGLLGTDVTGTPAERRRVGLVPQDGALFSHLDVAGNVGFGLRAGGPGRWRQVAAVRAVRRRRVGDLLELVGLADKGARMPHELSGGERRRVALARALAPEPAVVLLDEPFSALDAGLRDQVRADAVAALRAAGSTAVLITHDHREALSVSDRVAVLDGGVLVQTASPRELYIAPVTARVAGFVGEASLLPAHRTGGVATTVLGRAPIRPGTAPGPDGAVVVVLRPEQVLIDGPSAPGTSAVVERVEFGGEALLVSARPDGPAGPPVRVRTAPGERWAPGDRCRLRIDGAVHAVPPAATEG